MKTITKWFEKHINMKNDEEFAIFLVWSVFSAVILFSFVA